MTHDLGPRLTPAPSPSPSLPSAYHRAPAPGRPRLTAGAWAVLAALVAVLVALGLLTHDRDTLVLRPTWVHGSVGETVEVAGALLTVREVTAAPTARVPIRFADDDSGDDRTTTGSWLLVRYDVSGVSEPIRIRDFWWETADARYRPSELVDLPYEDAQPGEWWHGDLLFEVAEPGPGTLVVVTEGQEVNLPVEIGRIEVTLDDLGRSDLVEPLPFEYGRGS